MIDIFLEINIFYLVILFFADVISFTISTLSGGGGALLLEPLLNFLVGTSKTAPILNLGTFIGRPSRLILFWKHIHWRICAYYAIPAIAGAWMGAWLFGN